MTEKRELLDFPRKACPTNREIKGGALSRLVAFFRNRLCGATSGDSKAEVIPFPVAVPPEPQIEIPRVLARFVEPDDVAAVVAANNVQPGTYSAGLSEHDLKKAGALAPYIDELYTLAGLTGSADLRALMQKAQEKTLGLSGLRVVK